MVQTLPKHPHQAKTGAKNPDSQKHPPQKAKIPRIPQDILPQNTGKTPGVPGIPAKKHHR